MNPDRDFNRPTEANTPFGRHDVRSQQIRPLRKDELDLWNNCLSEGFIKWGIPFGVVSHFISTYMLKRGNKPLPSIGKRTAYFAMNSMLGFICYTPICFSKLEKKYMENEEKMRQMSEEKSIHTMGGESTLQSESNPYQGSLDPKLDGPMGNFSHLNLDFTPSLESFEGLNNQEIPKKPEVTYDELRQRNRENYSKHAPPPSPYGFQRRTPYSSPQEPSKLEPPAPQPVTPSRPKNKYGDEME